MHLSVPHHFLKTSRAAIDDSIQKKTLTWEEKHRLKNEKLLKRRKLKRSQSLEVENSKGQVRTHAMATITEQPVEEERNNTRHSDSKLEEKAIEMKEIEALEVDFLGFVLPWLKLVPKESDVQLAKKKVST